MKKTNHKSEVNIKSEKEEYTKKRDVEIAKWYAYLEDLEARITVILADTKSKFKHKRAC